MPELYLKKINSNDCIEPWYEILTACGKTMHEELGLQHWFPFMNLDKFKEVVKDKKLYGVYKEKTPIATFNLSIYPRNYYYDELWSNPSEKSIYLGQIGVKPNIQKQGIGRWCMFQIEKLARQSECKTIRFDALSKHPWLKNFYESLGCQACGIVKPDEWSLTCFEKLLD